jgi:hypothetical protein
MQGKAFRSTGQNPPSSNRKKPIKEKNNYLMNTYTNATNDGSVGRKVVSKGGIGNNSVQMDKLEF